MDSDQSGSPVGTASQHINFVMVFDCFWWLCTWGVIFGSPKEATQALRSRCLSSLDNASISPPCQTGGFRDSQSKPSSSRLGTPNFSSWSSCNGVVELPNICDSILSLWLKNIIMLWDLYWSFGFTQYNLSTMFFNTFIYFYSRNYIFPQSELQKCNSHLKCKGWDWLSWGFHSFDDPLELLVRQWGLPRIHFNDPAIQIQI